MRLARFQRAAFGAPLGKPAVKDRDILPPCRGEQEPRARGAAKGAVVIKDDRILRPDAEQAKPCCQLVRGWRGIGHARSCIEQAGQPQKPRAGDVPCSKFARCVARGGGQVMRCVEHGKAGGLEMA